MTGPDPVLASKIARAELWKRILIVVTAVMVTAVIVLLVVVLSRVSDVVQAIRDTQQSGSPAVKAATSAATSAQDAAEASQATNDQILDCLTPEGLCYQRGQQQTIDTLASVQRIIVLAAACAVDVTGSESVVEREAAITACVTDQLTTPQP